MPQISNVIRGISQTEKGARLNRVNQYVLEVSRDANKIQIKDAVESLFNVKVSKVNTQTYQGKWRRLTRDWGRRPEWKKAIVTVQSGQKIELK